jgi:hypothetical protein
MKVLLKTCFIFFFNVLTCFTVNLWQIVWLPVKFISVPLYRKIEGFSWSWGSKVAMLHTYYTIPNDIKFTFSGDYSEKEGIDGNNLIISNHVSSAGKINKIH